MDAGSNGRIDDLSDHSDALRVPAVPCRDAQLRTTPRKLGARFRKPVFQIPQPNVWLLAGIYFCILGANTALSFFTPTILHEAGFGGFSAMGKAFASLCVLGALGTSRYHDVRWHCAIAALVTLASILMLVFVWHSSRSATFAMLAFGMAGTGAAVSLFWQLPARFIPESSLAFGVPIISSVANVAGFLTPWLTGYLRDVSGSYASGFIAAAGVEVIAVVALTIGIPLVVRRQHGPYRSDIGLLRQSRRNL